MPKKYCGGAIFFKCKTNENYKKDGTGAVTTVWEGPYPDPKALAQRLQTGKLPGVSPANRQKLRERTNKQLRQRIAQALSPSTPQRSFLGIAVSRSPNMTLGGSPTRNVKCRPLLVEEGGEGTGWEEFPSQKAVYDVPASSLSRAIKGATWDKPGELPNYGLRVRYLIDSQKPR